MKSLSKSHIDVYCNDAVYEECGSGDTADELLLCDKRDWGFHLLCLRPITVSMPKGPWFCPSCSNKKNLKYFPLVQSKATFSFLWNLSSTTHILTLLGTGFPSTSIIGWTLFPALGEFPFMVLNYLKFDRRIGSSEDLLRVCTLDPENLWQLHDPRKLFVFGGGSDAVDPLTGDQDGSTPSHVCMLCVRWKNCCCRWFYQFQIITSLRDLETSFEERCYTGENGFGWMVSI